MMCGIIGYKGFRNAGEVVVHGLKSLEYRGYDSWGVCTLSEKGSFRLKKKTGKIGRFKDVSELGRSSMAIGHTRWATHGNVTQHNAHPHTNRERNIAVVHNGIIENYQELRDSLKKKGYRLKTQTDTEVIPHLIDYYISKGKDFEKAFMFAMRELEGYYAVAAMNRDSGKIIAARNGSPLVAGVADTEFFIASDVPAFLDFTKKVLFLDDHEMVVIDGDMRIYDVRNAKRKKKHYEVIAWDAEQAKKGRFDHFMMKEITEQVESIKRAINQDDEMIIDIAKEINAGFGVTFVGCGSSYNAALTGQYMFSKVAKKHVNVVLGSEFRDWETFLTRDSLILPISQSGETADIIESVRSAKKRRSRVVSIVNVMGSSLMRMSDHTFLMNAGPEICVLSTKSYTSQLTVLTQLAYASAGKLEKGKKELREASDHVREFFRKPFERKLDKLAEFVKKRQHVFVIGRGINYPTALEAALKIKEVSYIHAEGFAGGELKHGSIALIEDKTPCFVFAPHDESYKEIIGNAMEIKARGGYIIGISPVKNKVFDFHIKVPDVKLTFPLLSIVPIQILAYHLAVKLGCDPDKPRNLAKSVTVK